MPTRRLTLAALAAAAVFALAGCAAGPAASDAEFTIVATTTQVADLTRAVVGDTPASP